MNISHKRIHITCKLADMSVTAVVSLRKKKQTRNWIQVDCPVQHISDLVPGYQILRKTSPHWDGKTRTSSEWWFLKSTTNKFLHSSKDLATQD